MPALDTVGKIIDYARVLLQDTLAPYRYPTADLIANLNISLLDARRLRPDLFLYSSTEVPFYSVTSEVVDIDQQYRMALVYFVAGHAQLRDEEEVTDARAAAFISKFTSMLTEPIMPQSVARR
jgi:hypothetical protein